MAFKVVPAYLLELDPKVLAGIAAKFARVIVEVGSKPPTPANKARERLVNPDGGKKDDAKPQDVIVNVDGEENEEVEMVEDVEKESDDEGRDEEESDDEESGDDGSPSASSSSGQFER